MPEFTYAGQTPASYTETRDSGGFIVGTVEHGDTRDFGKPGAEKPEGVPESWPAPDGRWVAAGTRVAKAWPGVGADMYRAAAAAGPAPGEDSGEDAGTPAPDTGPGAGKQHDDTGTAPESHVTGAVAHLGGTSGEEQ